MIHLVKRALFSLPYLFILSYATSVIAFCAQGKHCQFNLSLVFDGSLFGAYINKLNTYS